MVWGLDSQWILMDVNGVSLRSCKAQKCNLEHHQTSTKHRPDIDQRSLTLRQPFWAGQLCANFDVTDIVFNMFNRGEFDLKVFGNFKASCLSSFNKNQETIGY